MRFTHVLHHLLIQHQCSYQICFDIVKINLQLTHVRQERFFGYCFILVWDNCHRPIVLVFYLLPVAYLCHSTRTPHKHQNSVVAPKFKLSRPYSIYWHYNWPLAALKNILTSSEWKWFSEIVTHNINQDIVICFKLYF